MGTVLIPGAGSQDRRYHCHPALKMRKQAPGGGATPGSPTVEGINQQHPPHYVTWLQAPQRSLAPKSQTCPLSKASICVWGFLFFLKGLVLSGTSPSGCPFSEQVPLSLLTLISLAKPKGVSFYSTSLTGFYPGRLGLLPLHAECFRPSTLCEQT